MLVNNFSTSTCFAIFELIKFMCFGSKFSYPDKESFIPRPPRTNAGTRNPCGLTRPAQESILQPGRLKLHGRNQIEIIMEIVWTSDLTVFRFCWCNKMLIYEVLKIRDFSKLLRQLFATPQKLLRDPLWGRDPPVGNHCLNPSLLIRIVTKFLAHSVISVGHSWGDVCLSTLLRCFLWMCRLYHRCCLFCAYVWTILVRAHLRKDVSEITDV